MAKYYSSTFGKISGKHGTAVAVTRKDGVTYLRLHVPPSNPRTDKQQAHRAKFALTSRALAPFNPIFKETMGITNGISTARSYAFKNAIVGEYPDFSIDYNKLMFSFGPIEKLHNASFTRNEGIVSINWDFEEMYNCHGDDSVSLVVFNKNTNQALHIKDIALRSDKNCQIDTHETWADADLYFWVYVRSGDEISDSSCVFEMTVGADRCDCPMQDAENINEMTVGADLCVCPMQGAGGDRLGAHAGAPVHCGAGTNILGTKQYIQQIILCIIVALGAISCNPQPEADKLLHQAQEVVEAYPDSAMKLIDSIFYPEKSFDKKLYMEFLVTQTEARYKTNRQIEEDTLIYKARDYFTKENNNPEQTAIAWLYSGYVYREQDKYADAMHHYKEAERYAQQTDNLDLKGLVKFNIGDLLSKQGLYKEALNNYKLAEDFYKQSSDKSYLRQSESLSAIGEIFMLDKKTDSTFFYLHKGLEIAEKYKDTELQSVLTQNLSRVYLETKQYDIAEALLKQSFKLNTKNQKLPYYCLDFANLYACIKDTDTITPYIQQLKEYAQSSEDYHFRANAYAFLSYWEKERDNYDIAFMYEEERNNALIQILKDKDNQKAYDAQLKYDYEYLQKMYYKNISFWQLVIFALLLTLIVLIFIWRRQRKITLINKRNTEAKLMLSQQLAEDKQRIISVALPYLNLHSSIQNQLLDFSSKVRGKDQKLGDALDELLKNNRSEFNETTQQIFTDELMHDVVGITKGLELLNPSDRLLILMLAIEVDNNDIAALLNTTPTNFKSKKSYLKKKIQNNEHQFDNYDLLISIF